MRIIHGGNYAPFSFPPRTKDAFSLDKPPIPPGVADLLAPFWVWLISFIGAAVGWLEDFKPEDDWRTKCLKAATRASSSALAAVLTYHMLLAMDVGEKWHVVLVGISGHMGVEALKWLGEFYKSKVKA